MKASKEVKGVERGRTRSRSSPGTAGGRTSSMGVKRSRRRVVRLERGLIGGRREPKGSNEVEESKKVEGFRKSVKAKGGRTP